MAIVIAMFARRMLVAAIVGSPAKSIALNAVCSESLAMINWFNALVASSSLIALRLIKSCNSKLTARTSAVATKIALRLVSTFSYPSEVQADKLNNKKAAHTQTTTLGK